MRAVIKFFYFAASLCNLLRHIIMQLLHIANSIIAAGYAALVGNNKNCVTFLGKIGQRFFGAVNPFQLFNFIQIRFINV